MMRPSLPSGFRDVAPDVFWERLYILRKLRKAFALYGFVPLETPAMEHLATLMGKYGEEGDQLLFKVLNSGNFLDGLEGQLVTGQTSEVVHKVSKKGLRYDLTIPLARYVAQHRHALYFPFKRYQIQPVWRADRPQKGRYREFCQCDVDVVGAKSLFHEASLLALADEVFKMLGIDSFSIQLNHRGLLKAIAVSLGMGGEEAFLCQTLDKLDKIGKVAVCQILRERGLTMEGEGRLQELFDVCEDPYEELVRLRGYLGKAGIDGEGALNELGEILGYFKALTGGVAFLSLRPTLARGLSYYTGAVFEVTVSGEKVGSVAGGGRYDQLTEIFGVKDMPGVGISFGIERIYDIMKGRRLFPEGLGCATKVVLVPMEVSLEKHAIDHLVRLRKGGVAAEMYPAGVRLKKVFSYAHKKKIPWVVVFGPEELAKGCLSVKNMLSGEQKTCSFGAFLGLIRAGFEKFL